MFVEIWYRDIEEGFIPIQLSWWQWILRLGFPVYKKHKYLSEKKNILLDVDRIIAVNERSLTGVPTIQKADQRWEIDTEDYTPLVISDTTYLKIVQMLKHHGEL